MSFIKTPLLTQPDLPLTTLSILYCSTCGKGFVIGWFDWVVIDGKITEGTKPTDWGMTYATCQGCEYEVNFDEWDLTDLVHKRLGDYDMGPSDFINEVVTGKSLFSWCEKHFQFFSLSLEEGLIPAEEDDFPDVPYFPQHFQSGENYGVVEISNPRDKDLPSWTEA
jgi:hypothetical protein